MNAKIDDNGTNNINRMNSEQKIQTAYLSYSMYHFNKIMKNKKVCCGVYYPVVYDAEVELAVSIAALPNVFPPSLLTIIIGWSFPSALSHQDT